MTPFVTMLATLALAALLVPGLTETYDNEHCLRKSRRPGVKTALEENIEAVFGTGDGLGAGAKDYDESCACVPYYQCDNNTVIENGRGLIDIRISDGLPCEDLLEVCCGTEWLMPATLPPPRAPVGCGRRNAAGIDLRITGNDAGEAQFAEFPWMVALLAVDGAGAEMFAGGGSLIHPSVVLTAAHSVAKFAADPRDLRVRLGEWDTQSTGEPLAYQQLEVVEVVLHPRFYRGGLHNDIALLVLRDPALPAANVATVCLPEQGETVDSDDCYATGWGKDEFGAAGCYQVILKSISLPIVRHAQCEKLLRRTRLGPRFRLHASFTCAGGEEGRDACAGDGGGPLVCPTPHGGGVGGEPVYQQAGIIAWGVGCGGAEVPGVYTDVALFRDWVDDRFAERGFDTASYRRP